MTDSDLQPLFTALSEGRTPGAHDFNASKMFSLLEDPFSIWCNFHAPAEAAVPETNRYEILRVRTDRHTRDMWIKQEFPSVIFVSGETDTDRFKATLAAMIRGEQAIANAQLWNLPQNVYGSINLLVRSDDAPSKFGPYHYHIYQFKRAHELKEHYILQVCLMNRILAAVQGYQAPNTRVFLRNHVVVNVPYDEHQERLAHELAYWRGIRDGIFTPEAQKPPKAASAPWRVYANKRMFETKDLLLLPHLNTEMRQCLKINGLFTVEDVAKSSLEQLRGILEEPYATETYYNALAYHYQKPLVRAHGFFPPPQKKHHLYFDFEATETFTKDSVSFVYLIGIWDKEAGKYVSFIAKTPEEEITIFEQFYNYIQDFDTTVLYHWTDFEVRKMKKLAAKMPEHAPHLQALIKLCFDLKVAVNKAFYLPAPSFSLKAAAPAFGFHWRQDDCGAMDSMVYFTNWLKTGDDSLISKVLMYNEDDCVAMLDLETKLKQADVLDFTHAAGDEDGSTTR